MAWSPVALTSYSLKEVFDSKIFHGRLTEEEAYDLCKRKLTNHRRYGESGKPEVYIWYLVEVDGKLFGRIDGYYRDSEVPFARHDEVQHAIHSYAGYSWPPGYFGSLVHFLVRGLHFNHNLEFNLNLIVERKNPHPLSMLARVATLDNCNFCCLRSLMEKIDELRIPPMEKEKLKKLVRGFHLILVSKLPNELCNCA